MINSLTSFRFIIAFTIYVFHSFLHFGWKTHIDAIDNFFSNSATFMTGFFVLSGFIMTHVYQHKNFAEKKNVLNFYIRRFAKIYPAYIISTIVFFVIKTDDFFIAPYQLIFTDIFMLQAFFPYMFSIGINAGTWSLSTEMFFYFLFPFFIILFTRNIFLTIFVGMIIACSITINLIAESSTYVYANPVFRVADFILGIGFYFLLDRVKKNKIKFNLRLIHFITIVLIFLITTFLVKSGKGKEGYVLAQALIAPLFAIWVFCVYHSKSYFYNNNIMVYLGRISYSFYLWQFIAIIIGLQLLESDWGSKAGVALLCFGINIVLSIISYHVIEEPLRIRIIKKISIK